MAKETKKVTVNGKQVRMVTFQDSEIHPELLYSYLSRGSTHSRMSLVVDSTQLLSRKIRKKIVKDVFKE